MRKKEKAKSVLILSDNKYSMHSSSSEYTYASAKDFFFVLKAVRIFLHVA